MEKTTFPGLIVPLTDTIGETVPLVRQVVCTGMEMFGIRIDTEINRSSDTMPFDIAQPDSPVRVLVIQTDEELAISRQVNTLITTAA